MKKTIIGLVAAGMILAALPATSRAANSAPGGVEGFLAGCCFGLRVGTEYNEIGTKDRDYASWFLVGCLLGPRTQMEYRDGKEVHWRDVLRLIPVVGAVWDGIDIAGGKVRKDIQTNYGVSYY